MINADVVYDKKLLVKFMKFNTVNAPWKWLIYIVTTLFIACSLIANIGEEKFYIFVLVAVLVVIMDFLVLFSYFIAPVIKFKNFTEDNNIKNHFQFGEESIKFSSETKQRKGSSEIKYQQIFSARESKTTIYIYVNRGSALIVEKSGIEDGKVSELKALLKEKIPIKRNKLKK